MNRKYHDVCTPGAAVRLHGYAPAKVLSLYRDDVFGHIRARVRITARREGFGPHGYRPGEIVDVRAGECIPRDSVRTRRDGSGRLYWPVFSIVGPLS